MPRNFIFIFAVMLCCTISGRAGGVATSCNRETCEGCSTYCPSIGCSWGEVNGIGCLCDCPCSTWSTWTACGGGFVETRTCTSDSNYKQYRCAAGYGGYVSSCSGTCSLCSSSYTCGAWENRCVPSVGATTVLHKQRTCTGPTGCSNLTEKACRAGYYGIIDQYCDGCTQCPGMTDTGGTFRYGENDIGNGPLETCIMSKNYEFKDEQGTYKFQNDCPAS